MRFHGSIDDREARSRAVSLLQEVELSRPSERIDQYPHELSDGMCQRVALGIGLAAKPDLLIADEPTSALDVIIQANILERLRDLRRDRSLAVLLVTHDLRVAASIADRVVVLYGGTVVERGPISAVFERPSHPYTQALIESFTAAEDEHTGAVSLPSRGCRFHRECPLVVDACRQERPSLEWATPRGDRPRKTLPDHRGMAASSDGNHSSGRWDHLQYRSWRDSRSRRRVRVRKVHDGPNSPRPRHPDCRHCHV